MAKILVIEDEKAYLANICLTLEKEGYETIKAESGEKGVEMARDHQPDLILCDIKMPEKSGFDVIKELKEDSITSDIPIIFLTVLDNEENIIEGQKLGAADYISKSSDIKIVIFSIQTHLELRGLIQTLEKMKNELSDKVDKLNTGIQKFDKEPNQEILVYKRQLEEKNNEIKFLREMTLRMLSNIDNKKVEIINENILHIDSDAFKITNTSSFAVDAYFNNALNQVKDKYGAEIASELDRALDIIKKSGNEAVENLKKFIEELNSEKAKKGHLKDYLDKIYSLVPLVDNISKIAVLISKIIP